MINPPLEAIRDQINRAAYATPPRRSRAGDLLAAAGFAVVTGLSLRSSPVLVVQFIVGIVSLDLMGRWIRYRFLPAAPHLDPARTSALLEIAPAPATRSLLIEAFIQRAQDRRAAMARQNGLLALCLVFCGRELLEPRSVFACFIAYGSVALAYRILTWLGDRRSGSADWTAAARALGVARD